MPPEPAPPEPDPNTASLAKAVASGQFERFQPLYDRVAPSLFAWARLRILPELRQRVDANDLSQEVWMRALAAFERFDPVQGSFRAWLFGVAKRVLLEGVRRARRDGHAAGSVFDLQGVPESVTAISTRLARDESLERLLAHVQQLERTDREILVHLGLEGLRAAEAAQRLGLEREMVTKRWQRLRAKLREQGIGGELFED